MKTQKLKAINPKGPKPDLRLEEAWFKKGIKIIAGVDEVGIGSWAGPLVSAAVILDTGRRLYKIRDSKLLDEPRREELYTKITSEALAYSVGVASIEEINFFGLSAAYRIAGFRAILNLPVRPGLILLDGRWNYLKDIRKNNLTLHTQTVTDGDSKSLTIAAASIVAKVHRDNLMKELHVVYPDFDFASNKGYPAPKHKRALLEFGPTLVHRKNYAPIKALAR